MTRRSLGFTAGLLLALAGLAPPAAHAADPLAPPALEPGQASIWLAVLGERAPLSSDRCKLGESVSPSPLAMSDPDPSACGICPQCSSVASCRGKQPGTVCNNLKWTCQIFDGCALSNCCDCLAPPNVP